MSWSIDLMGKPENVAIALTAESVKMSGDSKAEYDAALPHMVGLVQQNYGNSSVVIHVTANGSGYVAIDDTNTGNRSCNVKIETIYTELV